MRKLPTVVLVVMALACIVVSLFRGCGGTFDSSSVYRRFCGRDGLQVSWVKDYWLDDSTRVDVTVVVAKDSLVWESLLMEMNVHELIIQMGREAYRCGNKMVTSYLCARDHPETKTLTDSEVGGVVFIGFDQRTLLYSSIENKEQGQAFTGKKFQESF